VRGLVIDARGGEPLARDEALLASTPYRTTTDSAGRFNTAGGGQEVEVVLTPDLLRAVSHGGRRAGLRQLDSVQRGYGRQPLTPQRSVSCSVRGSYHRRSGRSDA
jgi:hypothetical protein